MSSQSDHTAIAISLDLVALAGTLDAEPMAVLRGAALAFASMQATGALEGVPLEAQGAVHAFCEVMAAAEGGELVRRWAPRVVEITGETGPAGPVGGGGPGGAH